MALCFHGRDHLQGFIQKTAREGAKCALPKICGGRGAVTIHMYMYVYCVYTGTVYGTLLMDSLTLVGHPPVGRNSHYIFIIIIS